MLLSLLTGKKTSSWCPCAVTTTKYWTPKRLWRWWWMSEPTPPLPSTSVSLWIPLWSHSSCLAPLLYIQWPKMGRSRFSIPKGAQQRMFFLRQMDKFNLPQAPTILHRFLHSLHLHLVWFLHFTTVTQTPVHNHDSKKRSLDVFYQGFRTFTTTGSSWNNED